MKTLSKLLVCCAAMAVIGGCSTKSGWSIPEPTEPLNTYVKERCYMPDETPKVRSGAGYVEEGTEYFFQYQCDKFQAPSVSAVAPEKPQDAEGTTLLDEEQKQTPVEET